MSITEQDGINSLVTQLGTNNIVLWSDQKKKEFVETFSSRVRVARFLLLKTAAIVLAKAKEKHYISDKHTGSLNLNIPVDVYDNHLVYQRGYTVGGRAIAELESIASTRAEAIIDKLPNLTEAVRIISPEISKMMEKKAALLVKAKEVIAKSQEVSGALNMADLDQEMTIAKFRQMVKDREKKRKSYMDQLDEIGIEGRELESKINKFLYSGLPGLSDAVVKLISDYIDKATGFNALNRRVEEQVKFGDSPAALEMLKTFEKDEAKISEEVQAQFDKAMTALRLSVSKVKTVKKLSK